MNQYHAERAYLLYLASAGISSNRRHAGPVNKTDYAAVYTPPTNAPMLLSSPCLIWRHRLDAYGYGTLRLDGKTCKAHRIAYEMSRGEIPEGKIILHMCHRRCCIQPAHLYAGTRKQNAEDRQTRLTEEGRWAVPAKHLDEYPKRIHDGMKYYWDEPPEIERTLFPQQTGEHCCEYTIPAGRMKLCQICFEPDTEWPGLFGNLTPRKEEVETKALCCQSLDEFFKGRGPGDPPLNIVPG